jgi:acyl carrier protein phosphodiesterase
LAVDRHFHNSQFFQKHTHAIRDLIIPALQDSVVRPSFLAHISLELMLDSTLLTENQVDAEDLYVHLRQADRKLVQQFLEINNLDDTVHFFTFFEKFIQANYLNSYRESHNLMYALNRSCMRIWKDPLNEKQMQDLSEILGEYHQSVRKNYMEIYDEIALVIDPLP